MAVRDQGAVTLVVNGSSKQAAEAMKKLGARMVAEDCVETGAVPGGAKAKDKCCLVPAEGSITMKCISEKGQEALVFEILIKEKG